jgi:hypothetical protein
VAVTAATTAPAGSGERRSDRAGDDDAREDARPTDHAGVRGHVAVGYLGLSNVPIAGGTGTLGAFVSAPVLGVRYWLPNTFVGIDAGLGISVASGSHDISSGTMSSSTDEPSTTAFAFHAGIPVALATGSHYTFELVPEINVGFANSTIKAVPPATEDTSLSGYRFDVGARAGAEIQFGFIGVPELALQASVGLFLSRQFAKASTSTLSSSEGRWSFASSLVDDPWQIFAGNVAALYYF